MSTRDEKSIAIWLLICCVTIFGMVVLGGVTRLTGSGLSMVQWAPIMGVLPPLSETEWQETFALYQQFPEYLKKNLHMDLQGFKSREDIKFCQSEISDTVDPDRIPQQDNIQPAYPPGPTSSGAKFIPIILPCST